MPTKVAIQYGIFGGHQRGKRFRKALAQAGLVYTAVTAEADVIVAHSAGCFWLPTAPTRQRLLLIDPPYWPGRTIRERARNRAKTNRHFRHFGYPVHYWLGHYAWGIYYGIFDVARTLRIIKHAPNYDLESVIQGHTVVLVHNDDDDWLTPELDHLPLQHKNLRVRHLPGDHDNCWYNPQPYVAIVANWDS